MSWAIDRVMIGDGRQGASGHKMQDGVLYAAAGLTGGDESFWPIDANSITLSLHTMQALLNAIDDGTNDLPRKKKFLQEMFRRLYAWMMAHRGVPILIGGIGARGQITGSRRFEVHQYGPNLVRSNDDSCVSAALSNGTCALYGTTGGTSVDKYLRKHPMKIKTLKQLFSLVHQIPAQLSVRRVPKAVKKAFDANPFKWLAHHNQGVWIVRIVEHGIVDHCVALDCNRGIVHDSASRYPFALTEDVLRLLGGDEAKNLRVAEVRELVKVPVNSKKPSRCSCSSPAPPAPSSPA